MISVEFPLPRARIVIAYLIILVELNEDQLVLLQYNKNEEDRFNCFSSL